MPRSFKGVVVRIDLINEDQQFHALGGEWNQLLRKSSNDEIALTWEWMYTWWQVFKDDTRRLFLLAIRDPQNELIGIAPLYVQTIKPYFFLPAVNRIQFLGSGEATASGGLSHYLNFILKEQHSLELLKVIFDYLISCFTKEWDDLFLENMRFSAPTSTLLTSLLGKYPLRCQPMIQAPSSYVDLPENWDLFLQKISSDLRSDIRRNRKALAQEGQVDYLTASNEKTLWPMFEAFIEIHKKSQMPIETETISPGYKRVAFYKAFLPLALKNQWLRMSLLSLNHRPIAGVCNFSYNQKIYFHQMATLAYSKREFSKTISPGILLHSYCIENAILEGAKEYDLFQGNSVYEKPWEKQFRSLISIKILPKDFCLIR